MTTERKSEFGPSNYVNGTQIYYSVRPDDKIKGLVWMVEGEGSVRYTKSMTPEQARKLAAALIEQANAVEGLSA